ncbi:hypothetical protein Acr_00g0100600 [Actinidia rufa]|uniref:Uncharacterized protein n=1 Tax=Actinidia rufa TaxID=165716 RepID=A0A7J0DZU0_9ERIC|nr:hypothetical protein Acr_00g0100600 [Actinidia rufa]
MRYQMMSSGLVPVGKEECPVRRHNGVKRESINLHQVTNQPVEKKKMSAAAHLSRTRDKMLEVVQSQGSEVTVKPHADSNNAIIGNCLLLLANLPGIDPLSPLYLLGTQLITILANREVFMGLPNDDVHLAWLQLHRDQAVGIAPHLFQDLTLGPPNFLLLSWTTLMFYD